MTRPRSAASSANVGTSLLHDVFVLARTVHELLAADLAGAPLTADEYAVYSHVFEAGATTPTTMARALGVPATTVSDWLRSMTGRGHITRTPSIVDRRSFEIRLTTEGRRAHRGTNRYFEQANARFLGQLTHPEPEMRGYLAELIAAASSATRLSTADQNVSAGT